MHKYRVLMQDSVNGQSFSFAQFYNASGMLNAEAMAIAEYNCQVLKVEKIS